MKKFTCMSIAMSKRPARESMTISSSITRRGPISHWTIARPMKYTSTYRGERGYSPLSPNPSPSAKEAQPPLQTPKIRTELELTMGKQLPCENLSRQMGPLHMAVDHCFAFLWRIEAYAKAISPRFSCQLSVNSSAVEHNVELGEGLFSKSWAKQGIKLSLGTEDEDYLLQRAEAGHWLPTRFASGGHITFQQIISTERGIEVSLPNLRKGEKAQIQFVIAWTRSTESTIANWFAVDVGASEILAQGCA